MGLDVRLVGDLDTFRTGDGHSILTALSLLAWPSRDPVSADFTVGSSEALVNQSGRSFLDLFSVHGASTGTCAAASPTLEQDLMQNGRTVVTCSGVRFDEMLTVTVSAGLESPSGVALMGVDGMRPAQVTWDPAVDGPRAPHEPVEAVFASNPGAAR